MIFAGILLMLLMFGGMLGSVYYILKKTDPKNVDTSLRGDITTAQEFLPFTDIKDSMIHLGNHSYRAIVEVSSINYDLKTEKEQQIIEMSYTQFLNSLMFPITIFISTREMDNRQYLKDMQDDYEATIAEYPSMLDYANHNLNDMTTLNYQLGITRQKKKFVILSFDEANELSMQSDEEKYEHSARELASRARMVQDGLLNMGIQTRIHNTKDILELMVSTYHRDGYNYSQEIWDKNFLSMIVEGERNYFGNDLSEDDKLQAFMTEFENKLHTAFMQEEDVSGETRQKAEELLAILRGERAPRPRVQSEATAEAQAPAMDLDDDEDDFTQMKWQGVKKDEIIED